MRKRFMQKAVALAMAFALIMGEGNVALAAQLGNDGIVADLVEESADTLLQEEEIGVEQDSTPVSVEENSETDEVLQEETDTSEDEGQSTEDASEESSEAETEVVPGETTPDTVEQPLIEVELVEEAVSEEIEEIDSENMPFPGLAEDYRLTAAQKAAKLELSAYVSEIGTMAESVDYVPGEIMVEAASREEAEEFARAFGGTLTDYFSNIALITLEDKSGTGEVSVVKAVAASAQVDTLLPAAWPNYYRYIQAAVNADDPFLSESSQSYQWHHNVIGTRQAWAAGKTGSGVKVAVLDTGIKLNHEDVTATTATGFTGWDNDAYGNLKGGSTNNGDDGHGHGTHVAGIIAAQKNTLGGRGIAYEAELISVKVMGDDGSGTTADIVKGLDYAISQQANIINMSLGSAGYHSLEALWVKKAYEAGIAVFCAASNDYAQSTAYPAAYDGAIAIAAVDKNNHKADFSNYGSWVRYSAPGVNIYSTISKATSGNNAYGVMSGTSQATPVVSGIAALLWNEVEGEGKAKVDNLLKLMDKSCIKANGSGLGKGVVSLPKALGLDGVTTAPSKPVFSEKTGTVFVTDTEETKKVTITAGAESTIYYSTDGKSITYKNGVLSANAILYDKNNPISLNAICNASGKVTLKAIAVNNNNQLASAVTSASYTLKPKYATKVEIFSANGNNTVARGKSLKLTAAFTPAYVTDKSLEWTVEGSPAGITVKSGTVTVKNTAEAKEYTIKATPKSTGGNYTGTPATYKIQVTEGDNPITVIKIGDTKAVSKVNVGTTVSSTVTVTKKDKTPANVSDINWISADPTIAKVTTKGTDELSIQGLKAGKTKITGVAKDGSGKSISCTVTVAQPVTKITISSNAENKQVAAGGSITLAAKVEPENASNKSLTWTSSDPLVKVSSAGKVSVGAKATGQATITATAKDGSNQSATYDITILSGKIIGITLDQKSVNIFRVTNKFNAPTTATVKVSVAGDNTNNWTVISSNSDLVRIKSKDTTGVTVEATGKATGTATITVQSTDGTNKKASFKVNVTNPATALHIAPEKGRTDSLAYKKTLKLSGVLETSSGALSASGKKLKWESLNSYASVDQKGNVKALAYSTFEYSDSAGKFVFMPKYADIKVSTTDGSNLSDVYRIYLFGETAKVGIYELDAKGYAGANLEVGYEYRFTIRESYNSRLYGNDLPVLSEVRSYSVNKKGLSVYYGLDDKLHLVTNDPGTYKLTISYLDGSTAKKTYTFRVK